MNKILFLGINEKAAYFSAATLAKEGYVIDVYYWKYNPAVKSKYINKCVKSDLNLELSVSGFHLEFMDFLKDNKYDCIIPSNDVALHYIHLKSKEISKKVTILNYSEDQYKYAHNKYEIFKIKESFKSLKFPNTLYIKGLDDIPADEQLVKYEIIKPAMSAIAIKNTIKKTGVRKIEDNHKKVDKIRELIEVVPVMLQENVGLGFGLGFNFYAENGDVIVSYTHKRITEAPGGGVSSVRGVVSLPNELEEDLKGIIKSIKWNGLGMLEIKCVDGFYYFMELNGRYFGSISVGIHNGFNLPLVQVQRFYKPDTQIKLNHHNNNNNTVTNFRNQFQFIFISKLKIQYIKNFFGTIIDIFRSRTIIEDKIFDDFGFYNSLYFYDVSRAIDYIYSKIRLRLPVFRKQMIPKDFFEKNNEIIVLCMGNINRSPFLSELLKKKYPDKTVHSRGLISHNYRRSPVNALKASKLFDINLENHLSNIISREESEKHPILIFDSIIFNQMRMDKLSVKNVYFISREDITDPFGKDLEFFKNCYQKINTSVNEK